MDKSVGLSAALSHRMNYLVDRQGVISGNIANADTPDYLAKDVTFEKLVQKQSSSIAMATTNDKHMQGKIMRPNGKMVENKEDIRLDGNSVVYDKEMLKLSEIQLNHRLVNQIYAKQNQMQKLALGGK